MSDHEFEKQVNQKLEELKLRPSDAVWMEVQKNIRQDKRRRRFLWLWIPGIFIFLTTSAYILYRYTNNQPATLAQAVPTSLSNQTIAESTNSTQTTTRIQPASQNNLSTSGNAATPSLPQTGETRAASVTAEPTDQQPAIAITSSNTTNRNETTGLHNKRSVQKPKTVDDYYEMRPFVNQSGNVYTYEKHGNKKRNVVPPVAISDNENAQGSPIITTDAAQQEQNELTATVPAKAMEAERSIVTNKAAITPFNSQSLLLALDSTSTHTAADMPIKRNRPSLWHWGVVTDAGYSRISENKLFQLRGLLGKDKYLAEDLSARSDVPSTSGSAYLNYQSSSASSAAASKKTASPIQADFSFSAGVFVQRTLSPRLKLSLGLEYSYMSVNTQVGQKVDEPIVVNMGTSMVDTVRQYYKLPGYEGAGVNGSNYRSTFYNQTYRYRFHYIEIPLTVNWQVNKGRRIPPIVFEGGVSYARLLTVNALHYEGIKGVYYQNDDLFNKTQFNFVTGLSVGLLQRSKHPIWIGPNLRYSLNGLVKKEVSTGQYLWSTGISVKMSLGRL